MLGLGYGENYLLIIHQRKLVVVSWIYVYNNVYFIKATDNVGPRLWGKLPPDYTSAKPFNIFESKICKNDLSSMIDDGCKGCSLCSFNFTILLSLTVNNTHLRFSFIMHYA